MERIAASGGKHGAVCRNSSSGGISQSSRRRCAQGSDDTDASTDRNAFNLTFIHANAIET